MIGIHIYNPPGWLPGIWHGEPCNSCGSGEKSPLHILNGGVACDLPVGPCACGAFHTSGYVERRVMEITESVVKRAAAPGYAPEDWEEIVLKSLIT